MSEVRIELRPLPRSTWIEQDWAFRSSNVCFAHEAEKHKGPLKVTKVTMNGVSLPFRLVDATTVRVFPNIPLEGGRLVILCSGPQEPQEPLKAPHGTYPLDSHQYGLQRPHTARMEALR